MRLLGSSEKPASASSGVPSATDDGNRLAAARSLCIMCVGDIMGGVFGYKGVVMEAGPNDGCVEVGVLFCTSAGAEDVEGTGVGFFCRNDNRVPLVFFPALSNLFLVSMQILVPRCRFIRF